MITEIKKKRRKTAKIKISKIAESKEKNEKEVGNFEQFSAEKLSDTYR